MTEPPARRDTWTVGAALEQARRLGIDRIDARRLVAEACGRDPTWVFAHPEAPIDPGALSALHDRLERRADGVPLAYLLGRREFHGLLLQVDERVLDPRADTETLVDWALEWLAARTGPLQVLDLGTGSGAIALALARACPAAEVWAVDRSADALSVARANGQSLGLPVHWVQGDWWQPAAGQPALPRAFDLVVANPPYLAADDPHLRALRHEPLGALVSAGAAGLGDLQSIVDGVAAHLAPRGAVMLEHGATQGPAVRAMLAATGARVLAPRHDLAGHWRCTGAAF